MSKLYSQKNKDLLEKLRSARLEAGLTQIQASKKLKKPQSYLSKIERGERKIEAIELGVFAKIYNKDINYFIK
jgi:transcriptional regulator with XRE-family HTH domain